MINNFQEYVNIKDGLAKYRAICVEDYSWAKEFQIPNMELDIPSVTKKGKIIILINKKNPIFVQLDDGSKLFFTNDEFKRINGVPVVGKTMVVKLLRLPQDSLESPSQIKSCQVF